MGGGSGCFGVDVIPSGAILPPGPFQRCRTKHQSRPGNDDGIQVPHVSPPIVRRQRIELSAPYIAPMVAGGKKQGATNQMSLLSLSNHLRTELEFTFLACR